jgi:hypothetical protein
MPIKSATATLSAVGTSQVFPLQQELNASLLPGLLCSVSSGATLTYSVEITGDNVFDPAYNPANGNWFPVDNLANLSASANGSLVACCTGIRLHVTAWTGGSVTLSFCWMQN